MAAKLTVVTPAHSGIQPARKLGRCGTALWLTVMRDYEVADAGGLEMLTQACAALDRAEDCCAQITKDGAIVRFKGMPREHPLLKIELANRAFVVRTLARLGLDVEAVKPVGRPSRPLGWKGDD